MYLVSRTETFAKLFFLVSFSGLFMYITLAFYSFHAAYSSVSQIGSHREHLNKYRNLILDRSENDLKYIVLWTSTGEEYNPVGEGQLPFIDNNCSNINCFLTTNKSILNGNYINFDAVIFNISILGGWNRRNLPLRRLGRQVYIFHGMVPSEEYPLCYVHLDNYFNWTWSYKMASDIFTPFIEVRDLEGKVVAPKSDVVWTKELNKHDFGRVSQPSQVTEANISSIDEVNIKTKALVWVMRKCPMKLDQMLYTKKLKVVMKQYSLAFDIYGCGNLECPEGNCLKAIESHYYFYLVLEEGKFEDYVTTQVLMAYHHDAIPIVTGGANYTKYLPANSYIDSSIYTPVQLAAVIYYIIKNPSVYQGFFQWKSYYTLHEVNMNRGFCELCSLLNDKDKNSGRSHKNFRRWWYQGPLREKCYPKGAERYEDVFSYVNDSRQRRNFKLN